jgi:hypothetical protein
MEPLELTQVPVTARRPGTGSGSGRYWGPKVGTPQCRRLANRIDLNSSQRSGASEELLSKHDHVKGHLDGLALGGGAQDRLGTAQGFGVQPELLPHLSFAGGTALRGFLGGSWHTDKNGMVYGRLASAKSCPYRGPIGST